MANNWVCSQCQETIEPQFEYCWNCGTSFDGRTDPNFVSQREPRDTASRRFYRFPLAIQMTWFVVCAFLIFGFAIVTDRNFSDSWSLYLASTVFLFIFGLLIGVLVNVTGQLYWLFRDNYFAEPDAPSELVQIQGPDSESKSNSSTS